MVAPCPSVFQSRPGARSLPITQLRARRRRNTTPAVRGPLHRRRPQLKATGPRELWGGNAALLASLWVPSQFLLSVALLPPQPPGDSSSVPPCTADRTHRTFRPPDLTCAATPDRPVVAGYATKPHGGNRKITNAQPRTM